MDQEVDDLWKVFRVAKHCARHRPRIENIARRMMYLKQRHYTPVAVVAQDCGAGWEPRPGQFGYNNSYHLGSEYEQMGEVCLPQFSFYENNSNGTTPGNVEEELVSTSATGLAFPDPFKEVPQPAHVSSSLPSANPAIFSVGGTTPAPIDQRYSMYDSFSNGSAFGANGHANHQPMEPVSIPPSDHFDFNEYDTAFTTPVASYVSLPDLAGTSASASAPIKDGKRRTGKKNKPPTQCTNCGSTKTPLWRRNPQGQPLCNACGLFLKLHGVTRPLSLKTDVIKKRQRRKDSMSKSKSSSNLKDLDWLI